MPETLNRNFAQRPQARMKLGVTAVTQQYTFPHLGDDLGPRDWMRYGFRNRERFLSCILVVKLQSVKAEAIAAPVAGSTEAGHQFLLRPLAPRLDVT